MRGGQGGSRLRPLGGFSLPHSLANLSAGCYSVCRRGHGRYSADLKHCPTCRATGPSISARQRVREETFAAYGGACGRCGSTNPKTFVVHHRFGGGNDERRRLRSGGGWSFYLTLRRRGFPPEYELLCRTCHGSKHGLSSRRCPQCAERITPAALVRVPYGAELAFWSHWLRTRAASEQDVILSPRAALELADLLSAVAG